MAVDGDVWVGFADADEGPRTAIQSPHVGRRRRSEYECDEEEDVIDMDVEEEDEGHASGLNTAQATAGQTAMDSRAKCLTINDAEPDVGSPTAPLVNAVAAWMKHRGKPAANVLERAGVLLEAIMGNGRLEQSLTAIAEATTYALNKHADVERERGRVMNALCDVVAAVGFTAPLTGPFVHMMLELLKLMLHVESAELQIQAGQHMHDGSDDRMPRVLRQSKRTFEHTIRVAGMERLHEALWLIVSGALARNEDAIKECALFVAGSFLQRTATVIRRPATEAEVEERLTEFVCKGVQVLARELGKGRATDAELITLLLPVTTVRSACDVLWQKLVLEQGGFELRSVGISCPSGSMTLLAALVSNISFDLLVEIPKCTAMKMELRKEKFADMLHEAEWLLMVDAVDRRLKCSIVSETLRRYLDAIPDRLQRGEMRSCVVLMHLQPLVERLGRAQGRKRLKSALVISFERIHAAARRLDDGGGEKESTESICSILALMEQWIATLTEKNKSHRSERLKELHAERQQLLLEMDELERSETAGDVSHRLAVLELKEKLIRVRKAVKHEHTRANGEEPVLFDGASLSWDEDGESENLELQRLQSSLVDFRELLKSTNDDISKASDPKVQVEYELIALETEETISNIEAKIATLRASRERL